MAKGIVVIDPGHGGALETGGSSANNATSPSGILEKNLTLKLGLLVRDAINATAATGNHDVKVIMTRDSDKNLGLAARANVAKANRADLFLSIHLNASNAHNARGVETLVRPKAMGNTNHADDSAFARRVQAGVLNALRAHDPATKDRKVKDQILGVLKDKELGSGVRACLLEVEFMDTQAVDELLNIGASAAQVRSDIADGIARACIDELKSSSRGGHRALQAKSNRGMERAMNTASQNRLKKVHPELARRVTLLIEALAREGLTVEVVQGLRTFAEQDALFRQGRTKPGPIVTRAKGGQSNHNYGLAVDLCPFVNGKPQWNDNPGFMRIGVEAAKLGLEWGGSWKKFLDKPHVQMPGLTVAQCLALYKKGGLPHVWAKVPAIV